MRDLLPALTFCICLVCSTPYLFDYLLPGTAMTLGRLSDLSQQRQPALDNYRIIEQELSLIRSARSRSATPPPAPNNEPGATELGPLAMGEALP
jgi:hypothetical protein